MARKQKSVYERIELKENEIKKEEEKIIQLKKELEFLNDEKDEFEMRKIFKLVKEKNMTIQKVEEILSK